MMSRDAVAAGIQHHTPKVKRIIQLFMTGGASPMDLFDYKPELARLHGQMLGPKEKPEGQTGMPGAIMKTSRLKATKLTPTLRPPDQRTGF